MSNNNTVQSKLLKGRDVLVCVFQRGAADGLNSLVPYSDPDYPLRRPGIAVPPPGAPGGGIYLSDAFALHPALAPLKPIYDAGDLALLHAIGVPHFSRSHFVAQNLVERGVIDKNGPVSGWLARHLEFATAATDSAFRAISFGTNVPVTLKGNIDPLALDRLDDLGFAAGIRDSGYPELLDKLFRSNTPFAEPAHSALDALDELDRARPHRIKPDNGARYPKTVLGKRLRQAGQLIQSKLKVEVICIDSDGWDHHGSLPLYLNQSLADLGASLAAFYTDMGKDMKRISVLVFSEFGRRVAENGSLGADHGSAGLAYVMGRGVNGGQIIADWPGLDAASLEAGEDLRITTDLRSLIVELLHKRLGGTDISTVFPGFTGPTDLNAFLD